ncbi:DUF2147 domain-containing protein [Ascidiimonas sp. W6]|uniref:DUF2147 domain-containing protein n=1 Tax=Ascidiimonas meishanensis TaxID=3128903 RepID=UPI0030EBF3A7
MKKQKNKTTKKIDLFKSIVLMIILLFAMPMQSQDIFGKWKSIDHETGEIRSIIEVYEEEGKVFGKIIKVLAKGRQNGKCTLCPGDKKNEPLKGLVIIEGLEKEEDAYSGGTIIDPAKGKKYRCKIWVDPAKPDVLNVRGYVSLFYKTQYWPRSK